MEPTDYYCKLSAFKTLKRECAYKQTNVYYILIRNPIRQLIRNQMDKQNRSILSNSHLYSPAFELLQLTVVQHTSHVLLHLLQIQNLNVNILLGRRVIIFSCKVTHYWEKREGILLEKLVYFGPQYHSSIAFYKVLFLLFL